MSKKKLNASLTNPVSTFGVTIIFDPFTIAFSVSVPSCSSLCVKKERDKETLVWIHKIVPKV